MDMNRHLFWMKPEDQRQSWQTQAIPGRVAAAPQGVGRGRLRDGARGDASREGTSEGAAGEDGPSGRGGDRAPQVGFVPGRRAPPAGFRRRCRAWPGSGMAALDTQPAVAGNREGNGSRLLRGGPSANVLRPGRDPRRCLRPLAAEPPCSSAPARWTPGGRIEPGAMRAAGFRTPPGRPRTEAPFPARPPRLPLPGPRFRRIPLLTSGPRYGSDCPGHEISMLPPG